MNKKISIFVLILFLAASINSFAQELTGKDYLKMSYRQRPSTIAGYINQAKRDGVTIKNSPVFYCKKLDAFYAQHPPLTKESLVITLKTLIIMEYDWHEKGVDKDELAQKWLGEDLHQANKRRLKN